MMNIVFVIVLALWIYILTVLKRGKLDFWYFITGSIGLFVFMLIKVEPVVLAPLQKSVSAVAGMFGDMTGIYEGYFNKNIVFIATGDANLSMYIDYECSGIVEMLAFLCTQDIHHMSHCPCVRRRFVLRCPQHNRTSGVLCMYCAFVFLCIYKGSDHQTEGRRFQI